MEGPAHDALLERSRVSAWLSRSMATHPVRALVGPAGSGKSSAVRSWLAGHARNTIWLDPRRAGALERLSAANPEDLVVIEDAHELAWTSEHELTLERLVERGAHVLFLSRREPPVNWQRWRGRGLAAQLQTTELFFSRPEIVELLALRAIELSDEQIDELAHESAGWPALIEIVLEEHHRQPGTAGLPFSAATHYLREEVLQHLSEPHLRFLARVAHLGMFDAELASVVLDDQRAPELIDEVWRESGLLIADTDGRGRYSVPSLIRQVVTSGPHGPDRAELTSLHHAASLHNEYRGDWDAAITHMLHADPQRTVHQLMRMLAAREPLGRSGQVLAWFDRLPRSVRSQPSAVLGMATALIQAGLLTECDDFLERAAAETWQRRDHTAEYLVLRATVRRILFRHADAKHAARAGLEMVRGGLSCSTARASHLRLFATEQLIEIALWEGELASVEMLAKHVRSDPTTTENHLALVHSMGVSAITALDRGEISTSAERATATLRVARRQSFEGTHVTAEASFVLASVEVESGHDEPALERLQKARAVASSGIFPTTVIRIELLLATVLGRLNRHNEATSVLEEVARRTRHAHDQALQARLLAATGVVAAHRGERATLANASLRLRGVVSPASVLRDRMRLALALNSRGDIRSLRREFEPSTDPANAVAALLCSAHEALPADHKKAAAALSEAAQLAERAGLWLSLVDLCVGLEPALFLALQRADLVAGPTPDFLRKVAEELARRNDSLLSPRELEVAKFLSTRLTNGQIAGKLFISENTVKTHLRHIYQKLGVDDRDEAVLRLQELGFPLASAT